MHKIMIADLEFIKQFNSQYEVIRQIGYEYLSDIYLNSQIKITTRLSDDFFKSILSKVTETNGVIPLNKIKFILFIYAHFLNEKYLNELNGLIKDLKDDKYKYWVALICWRKDSALNEYTKEEIDNLINTVPENTGNFESIEWRLRIKQKNLNNVIYSKSSKLNLYNKTNCRFNLNRIFTTENLEQKKLMIKYEEYFSRIRKIKKYISLNVNNNRAIKLNIMELFK